MSVLRRLNSVLLATAVALQVVAPSAADAAAYMRLRSQGSGAGLGGTTGSNGGSTTGPNGSPGTGASSGTGTTTGSSGTTTGTGTTGTTGTTGAGSTTGSSGTTTGTGSTTTMPTAGKITVAQNTDGSVTTTTQGTDGTVTKVTKQQDGSTTTTTTTPGGTVSQTQTTTDSGGNVTTSAPVTVTSGDLDGTGTVTAHPRQSFRAQFTTTSSGTPVWQLTSAAPAGVVLSSKTGTLTGAVADQGAYPVQVTDGIVAKPYAVNLNVIPPLDVYDAKPVLRVGTYYQGFYGPANLIGQGGETLTPLPNGLVLEPWGYVHGTPTDTGYSATSVAVTLQDSGDTGPTGTVTKNFPITYLTQPLAIGDYPDLTVTAGQPVSVPGPTVTGGPVNPRFTLQGGLPNGVSFDGSTGAISGTPTNVPSVTQLLTVTVTDDTGASATTDPFHVGPAVTGTGVASSEYPVQATDMYCTYAHSSCQVPFETYYTRSGAAPRSMVSGMVYTYAHPVVADGTFDVTTADGNTDYVLYYNASTSGGTDWEPVQGTVLSGQFLVAPSSSNGDYNGARVLVRARIGDGGTFPGWEPYLPAPVTVTSAQASTATTFDLSGIMPPTDGSGPFTYLLSGMPNGVTFDGAHTVTVAPGLSGILGMQVAVADVAALPSLPQKLTIQGQSSTTAATAYPVSATGGAVTDPNYGIGTFYSNAASVSPYTFRTVLTYAQPTMADQTLDVSGNGANGNTLYYDNGLGANGNTDWEPVPTGGMTSNRFMFGQLDQNSQRLRVGYGGAFPPFLPHLVDGRASSVQTGKAGFVDLARAMVPVDGTGPFTYAIRSSTVRLDGVAGYTNPSVAAGLGNVTGATFDGVHAITFDGSTPSGTYALQVTVSDANGYHSPAAYLYLDVQSSLLASKVYPTTIAKRCCYGPDIPTGTAYSENATRERDDGAYGWNVAFAAPVQLDGSIDYLGDESAPTIFAPQLILDQWGYVEAPYLKVTQPASVTASNLVVQPLTNGDGAAHMRLGFGGAFPDWLPSVTATAHTYLIGGSLGIPVGKVMDVIDVEGADSYSLADNTSLPGGTSSDGHVITGAIADAGPYAPHLAVSDSRGFVSRGQPLTLTGTTAADPSYGGQYAIADYPDKSVRAGQAIKIPASVLTGPWVAPRLALNGALPAGLTFNADGSITGTPTADATAVSTYTVTATDAYGYNVTTDPFHLTPYGTISISDGSLPATFMMPYSGSLPAILHAVGNTDGATWKVTTGVMPTGVALDVKTGALDGTPIAMEANDPMTVQVTSATGQTSTAQLNIPVTMWATRFDGSSNFVTLPDLASTFGGGSTFSGYTAAAWVNPTAPGNWERVFEFASAGDGQNSQALGHFQGGSAFYGADGNGNMIAGGGNYVAGQWVYVAEVQDGTLMTIYVDGVAMATSQQGTPSVIARPLSWLGKSSFYGDSLFNGQMADFQFYNRPLSAAELGATQSGSALAGLVGRYLSTPLQYVDQSNYAGSAVPNGSFTSVPFIPPTVSATPGPNDGWAFCAYDGDTCSVASPAQFRYGTNGSYVYGTVDASTSQWCSSRVLGDPAPGLAKNCQVKSATTPAPVAAPTPAYALTIAGYADKGVARGQGVATGAPVVTGNPVNPTFVISPALPAGLSFNKDGSISGSLAHSMVTAATYTVTVHDDRGLQATGTFTLTPTDPLTLSAYPTLGLAKGDVVSAVPTVGGAPESPSFSISPALPAGLALGADGSISGTLGVQPAAQVTYAVALTDLVGRTASAYFTIIPRAASVTTGAPTGGSTTAAPGAMSVRDGTMVVNWDTTGIQDNVQGYLSAQVPNGTQWTVTAGTYPSGMSMDASGNLTGRVFTPGIFTVALKATAPDGTGAAANLTVQVPYIAGTFDGSSYITLPSDTSDAFFDANGNFKGFTVTAWVNFSSTGAWQRIWDLAAGPNGNLDITTGRSSNGTQLFASTNSGNLAGGNIVNGTWTHVATTMNISGLLSIYQDGQLVAQGNYATPTKGDRPLSFIGESSYTYGWSSPDATFAGDIGDFQVYGRALSQAQVQAVSTGKYYTDIQDWYLGSIWTTYDMSMRFANPAAHASSVNGNVGQLPFIPRGAPGN